MGLFYCDCGLATSVFRCTLHSLSAYPPRREGSPLRGNGYTDEMKRGDDFFLALIQLLTKRRSTKKHEETNKFRCKKLVL